MNIPCENCILFALCNSNQTYISCPLLFNYIVMNHLQLREEKIKVIENLFNKCVNRTDITHTIKNKSFLTIWWKK